MYSTYPLFCCSAHSRRLHCALILDIERESRATVSAMLSCKSSLQAETVCDLYITAFLNNAAVHFLQFSEPFSFIFMSKKIELLTLVRPVTLLCVMKLMKIEFI